MATHRDSGSGREERLGGLIVFRHDDYTDKVGRLPIGTDDLVMVTIRRHLNVFRKSRRASRLVVAVMDPHFCPEYGGPAFEVLFGVFQQFALLDIRMGGFSEEELIQYDKIIQP